VGDGEPLGTVARVSHVRWTDRPALDRPVLVAAFEGWNDAGDAATSAISHLGHAWAARKFASIDPEEFFDFTVSRPHVRIDGDDVRQVEWPGNDLYWADPPGSGGVVLLRGTEPQLRWRTFCEQVLEVAHALDCRMVVTLGALLADVAHTRPTPVYGNAYSPDLMEQLGLEASRYEGPTGIVGVLHVECRDAGLDSASLWAAVPSYAASVPSPKAALALVERSTDLIGAAVGIDELLTATDSYEDRLTELVEEDEATAEYVAQLEESFDQDAFDQETLVAGSGDELVEEVERFLREQ
jgi:proteasome assembly chaperone (PAC2) family protein